MEAILEVQKLTKSFGRLAAVKDLSFKVDRGQILGIAGPNGAGKTTLFNCVTKIPYSPDSGRVLFGGKDLTRCSPSAICHSGIARTFQIPSIFGSLTVYQNVIVGSTFGKTTAFSGFMRRSSAAEVEKGAIDALRFVGLLDKKDDEATGLRHFDIKRLMIASALATRPSLLMLDEPVAGLGRPEIRECVELIKAINRTGMTIILIEHIMAALMDLSSRVMILDYGEKICEGPPNMVASDERVIEAYLGKEYRRT